MKLYYIGSKAELALAVREDWYTEWTIGLGRGVLLSAARPVPAPAPVVVLEFPEREVRSFARGPAWPDEYVVPAEIVATQVASRRLTFE